MFGWAFPASFHPLRALIYRNQPLKPTLTFDTIDRQRDRTKKLYRTLKEPLGTTKHSSEQSKDFIGYSKRRYTIIMALFASKKLDEMGHLHLLLDEMGLDEIGINLSHTWQCPPPLAFWFTRISVELCVSTLHKVFWCSCRYSNPMASLKLAKTLSAAYLPTTCLFTPRLSTIIAD